MPHSTLTGLAALSSLALLQAPAPGDDPAPAVADGLDRIAAEFVALVAAGIDGDPEVTGATLAAHFAPELADAVPPRRIEALFHELADDGPVAVRLLSSEPIEAPDQPPGQTEETAPDVPVRHWRYELEQASSLWICDLTLDRTGAAAGWLLRPGARHLPRAELDRAAQELDGEWGLALRLLDPTGAEVETVTRGSGTELLPLGSVFKLYVLAELAAQASAGEVDFDAEIPIREEARSLPSGTMQTLEPGTPIQIRHMARQMIAISDNTAADHLIDLVGRERIEEHLERYGNGRPDALRPFLRTIDLFLLKGIGTKDRARAFGEEIGGDLGAVAEAWAGAEPAERRAWLDRLWEVALAERDHAKVRARLLATYSLATLGAPGHWRIGWCARPLDLVELLTRAQRGELVDAQTSRTFLELYAAGPPQYLRPGVAEQGFKGGSETGVLALTVRVVMEDGRAVLACLARTGVSAFDPGDTTRTVALLGAWIRNLLEGEPVAETGPSDGGD